MRIYDPLDEERVRTAALLREWTRSGLIEPAQAAAIEPELKTNLRQTGRALRSALAIITLIVLGAEIGLWLVMTNARGETELAMSCLFFGAVNIVAAEFLIRRFSFYRFGVEEACAVMAIALLVGAGFILFDKSGVDPIEAVVIGILAAGGVYVRYGAWYALFGAAGGVLMLPSMVHMDGLIRQVVTAALALVIFVVAGQLRARESEDFKKDDFEWLEAAAFAAFYFFVHLRLNAFVYDLVTRPAIMWNSYVLIWIVPIIGLVIGFRARLRWMIRVSGLLFIVTLMTHKQFLGWPDHDWDLLSLGLLLSVVAIAVRRYLASGENAQRNGYTATRVLMKDKDNRSIIGTFGGLKQHGPAVAAPAAAPDSYGGGASGGAGASGKF